MKSDIGLSIAAVGFAYMGFEYDSGWAFLASVLLVLNLLW